MPSFRRESAFTSLSSEISIRRRTVSFSSIRSQLIFWDSMKMSTSPKISKQLSVVLRLSRLMRREK